MEGGEQDDGPDRRADLLSNESSSRVAWSNQAYYSSSQLDGPSGCGASSEQLCQSANPTAYVDGSLLVATWAQSLMGAGGCLLGRGRLRGGRLTTMSTPGHNDRNHCTPTTLHLLPGQSVASSGCIYRAPHQSLARHASVTAPAVGMTDIWTAASCSLCCRHCA